MARRKDDDPKGRRWFDGNTQRCRAHYKYKRPIRNSKGEITGYQTLGRNRFVKCSRQLQAINQPRTADGKWAPGPPHANPMPNKAPWLTRKPAKPRLKKAAKPLPLLQRTPAAVPMLHPGATDVPEAPRPSIFDRAAAALGYVPSTGLPRPTTQPPPMRTPARPPARQRKRRQLGPGARPQALGGGPRRGKRALLPDDCTGLIQRVGGGRRDVMPGAKGWNRLPEGGYTWKSGEGITFEVLPMSMHGAWNLYVYGPSWIEPILRKHEQRLYGGASAARAQARRIYNAIRRLPQYGA